MQVDVSLLKKLRAETDESISLCKNALLNSDGEYENAKKLLLDRKQEILRKLTDELALTELQAKKLYSDSNGDLDLAKSMMEEKDTSKYLDIEKIGNYLDNSSNKSVQVDISISAYPGFVREVKLTPSGVYVSYFPWGLNEAGVKFLGKYVSLDSLVKCLEDFIGKPVNQWFNYKKYDGYPEEIPITEEKIKESYCLLEKDIKDKSIKLPDGIVFECVDSSYGHLWNN